MANEAFLKGGPMGRYGYLFIRRIRLLWMSGGQYLTWKEWLPSNRGQEFRPLRFS
jgi:hypothetical protein